MYVVLLQCTLFSLFIVTWKTKMREEKLSLHLPGVHLELLSFGHIQDQLNFQETLAII